MSNLFAKTLHSFVGKTVKFDDILVDAGLDVVAEKCNLEAKLPEPFTPQDMEHLCAIYDTKTGLILSDRGVSKEYGIVQYSQALGLVEELIENDYAQVLYAGAPGRKATAYIVLAGAGKIQLADQVAIENLFTLYTTHDGTSRLVATVTPILAGRTVFLPREARNISLKHSKHVQDRLAQATKVIKGVTEDWSQFSTDAQNFLKLTISEEEAINYYHCVFHDPNKLNDSTKFKNIIEELVKYFNGTHPGIVNMIPGIKGTLFAAYAGFHEWVDDGGKVLKKSKLRKDVAEAEIFAKLRGQAARQKAEAYAVAVGMTRTSL